MNEELADMQRADEKMHGGMRKAVEKTPSVGSGLFERDSLIYWLWMALWTLHFWTVPPKVDKPLTESATLTLTPVLIKEWTCSIWPY